MCIGGAPSVSPPPPPPEPPPTPQTPDGGVQNAGQDAKKKAAALAGAGQTNATSPAGLTQPASTTGSGKTLLGG